MITQDGFNAGLVILKAAFNLKDFERDTIGVWFTLLEESDIDDLMFLKAIKRLATYEENWYTVGSNFVGKIMKAVVTIRAENADLARHPLPEDHQIPEPDPMANNPEFNAAMIMHRENRGKPDRESLARTREAQTTMERLNKEAEGENDR